jgi:hypothetical protein
MTTVVGSIDAQIDEESSDEEIDEPGDVPAPGQYSSSYITGDDDDEELELFNSQNVNEKNNAKTVSIQPQTSSVPAKNNNQNMIGKSSVGQPQSPSKVQHENKSLIDIMAASVLAVERGDDFSIMRSVKPTKKAPESSISTNEGTHNFEFLNIHINILF